LAALTSNQCGFVTLLVNGRPLKAWNQEYNKRRAALQAKLAKTNRFTSRKLEQLTDKRNNQSFVHIPHARFIQMLRYKVFPTAFDGLGIGVSAVRPRRLAF